MASLPPQRETASKGLAAFLRQALAQVVIGSRGRAAQPLSRAIALITAQDGNPPTELRGLYAWFRLVRFLLAELPTRPT
jgi:hypothetical protein